IGMPASLETETAPFLAFTQVPGEALRLDPGVFRGEISESLPLIRRHFREKNERNESHAGQSRQASPRLSGSKLLWVGRNRGFPGPSSGRAWPSHREGRS